MENNIQIDAREMGGEVWARFFWLRIEITGAFL
jgi:hypothetical protein